MELKHTTLLRGLQVLKWVSEAEHPSWTDAEAAAIADILEVFRVSLSPAGISALSVADAPRFFEANPSRLVLIQVAIFFAAIQGSVSREKVKRVRELASVLGISRCRNLEVLNLISQGKILRVRTTLMPHFWAVRKLKERYRSEGLRAVIAFFRANFLKTYRNEALAAKYRPLASYPEGTLGREYARYIDRNHFSFPGEKGAASEIITFHDLSHVLAGYDTTPEDEVLAAAFMAGYMRDDDFNILMFVLLQFHLGIQVTPGAKPEVGHFRIKPVLYAIERGAAMNVELTKNWDYWEVMHVRLAELRARYGIPSLDEVGARFAAV